jgi:hypothetical protein
MQVNKNSSLLPGVTFTSSLCDEQCNALLAVECAQNQTSTGAALIIGPTCSNSAEGVDYITGSSLVAVPTISATASASALSVKSQYPLSARTISTVDQQVRGN